jgi:hypothetical protein
MTAVVRSENPSTPRFRLRFILRALLYVAIVASIPLFWPGPW